MASDRGDEGTSGSYEALQAENQRLRDRVAQLELEQAASVGLADLVATRAKMIARLEARVDELERRLSQNSGNSGKPSSRDPAAERQRQAEERAKRSAKTGGTKRRRGKQSGAKGSGLEMSADPDEIIEHRPQRCDSCGGALDQTADKGFSARQVIDVPEIKPTVTEHRAHTYGCSGGHDTTAAFPR